mmetsp:Transcript_18913/g.52754  ORF Transcript_18913/g.52754 Transcript_18913/m.52754 type:complete len:651 (+) Transcript_18913:172-2124(+)
MNGAEPDSELEEGELPPQESGPKAPGGDQEGEPNKRELKKKRKLVLSNKGSEEDYYNVYGENAHASVELFNKSQVKVADLSGIVTWAIGSGFSPSWCFIKNKPLVRQVVLLFLSGIDAALWERHAAKYMPNMHRIFKTWVPVNALNAAAKSVTTATALLSCPLTKAAAKRVKLEAAAKAPFPPDYYVITLEEMENLNYPLPTLGEDGGLMPPQGYLPTATGDGSMDGVLVGLDCEMCYTQEGLELTRVTLVDEHGKVLLDELVKPHNPITDYNTKFSGITAEMMEGVTTTPEEARDKVLKVVHHMTLLVGHSLENDLHALRIIHPNCLDTAVMYPHPKGPPARSSLRFLADKFLKKAIQGETHDSVEDAATAMQLAKLKIKHGPRWGTEAGNSKAEPLVDVLSRDGRRCALVDTPAALHRHAFGTADAITVESDEESLQKMMHHAGQEGVQFLWGHWAEVSRFQAARAAHRRAVSSAGNGVVLEPAAADEQDTVDGSAVAGPAAVVAADNGSGGKSAGRGKGEEEGGGGGGEGGEEAGKVQEGSAANSTLPSTPPEFVGKTFCEVLEAADRRVGRLWEALPKNSLLVVATGFGDTAEMRRVQESRWRRRQEEPLDFLPPWQSSDEQMMKALAKTAGVGLCLSAVSHGPND